MKHGLDRSCVAIGARTAMQEWNGTGCEQKDLQTSLRTELEKAERPVNTQYFKWNWSALYVCVCVGGGVALTSAHMIGDRTPMFLQSLLHCLLWKCFSNVAKSALANPSCLQKGVCVFTSSCTRPLWASQLWCNSSSQVDRKLLESLSTIDDRGAWPCVPKTGGVLWMSVESRYS